jgi:hypothetical protein
MARWQERLNGDPLPWLLERDAPAVRHLALRDLVGKPADDAEVAEARGRAMTSDPIASILAEQDAEGWWVAPGLGYTPKYTSTVWNLIFLDQMGASGADSGIQAACEYVLGHCQATTGGFSATGGKGAVPSGVVHCLNGNLLRALIGFGWLQDERVQRSIDWQAAAITGEGIARWYGYTSGPGFACGANDGRPCAWGAIKAVLALARIPPQARSPRVRGALEAGVAFLLSADPAVADYPTPRRNTKPSGSWFKLGFPSGYVADVLQNLEALTEAGAAGDARLDRAVEWLLAQQEAHGRWANRYPYHGKTVRDIDRPNEPSKWVTLRACRVLKAVVEARA